MKFFTKLMSRFRRILPVSESNKQEEESGVATVTETKIELPKKYKVLLHNDDYTTMEFVIHVLEKFFNKSPVEAQAIMMEVHLKGVGVCGVFTYEVAESKSSKVNRYARDNGHPLKSSIAPE